MGEPFTITSCVYGQLPEVTAALREHASQLTVDGKDVVHSGGQREPIQLRIGLRLVR